MSLTLRGCLKQDCNSVVLYDTTGDYNAIDNAGGYGPVNGVTGPLDFDTYTLQVWPPSLDPSADPPSATINLKLPVPVGPDSDGNYYWEIPLVSLNVSSIEAGIWYAEAQGVKDGDTFDMPPLSPIFTKEFSDDLKQPLLAYDVACGCKDGCEDPLELYMMLNTLKCGGFCSKEKSEMVIAELRSRLPLCC